MHEKGYPDIRIVSTEDEMHRDLSCCYDNVATPLAMARLFDHVNAIGAYPEITRLIETCQTGTNRIPAAIRNTDAVVGHKTGTGDINPVDGRIIAVNDCGYINLPSGMRIAIAVFITDSSLSLQENEALIAEITAIILRGAGD